MHPEVERDLPGDCPKCGMALEPVDTATDEDDGKLRDMTRRFWIAAAPALPVFAIAMGGMIPGAPIGRFVPRAVGTWVEMLLATPVVLWAGLPFLGKAWQSVFSRNLSMFALVGVGTRPQQIRHDGSTGLSQVA
jgi:Cu+-exporting ATPase